MKKLKNCTGFSLIEMLVAVAILAIMVVGMGSGIGAGTRAYSDAVFFANSRTMADTINIAVSDTLRYGDLVRYSSNGKYTSEDGTVLPDNFIFSNFERGIINGYLNVAEVNGVQVIQVNDLQGSAPMQLVNMGAYPGMEVDNLKVTFNPLDQDGTTVHKNCFAVSYEIMDMQKTDREHFKVETTIRLLNPVPEETTGSGAEGVTPTQPTEESEPEQGTEPSTEIEKNPAPNPENTPDLSAYKAWDFEKNYEKGNIVQYANKLYVAKKGELEEKADEDDSDEDDSDEDDSDDINCDKNPAGNDDYWVESEFWDPEKEYNEDDIVVYDPNQTAYEAEKDSLNKVPPVSSDYWEKYENDKDDGDDDSDGNDDSDGGDKNEDDDD